MEDANKYTLEDEGISIVLIGSFNPAIFHPTWFANEELIGPAEAKKAQISVITNDIAIFSASVFRFEIQQKRFIVTIDSHAQAGLLKDLIIGTFKVLEHTPIEKVGINRNFHFKVHNAERWDELGHLLAPKKHWDMLDDPKTRCVTIEGKRPGSSCKYLQVKAEPSPKFPLQNVMAISTNEHYEADKPNTVEIMDFIESNWEAALDYSDEIAKNVMEISNGQ